MDRVRSQDRLKSDPYFLFRRNLDIWDKMLDSYVATSKDLTKAYYEYVDNILFNPNIFNQDAYMTYFDLLYRTPKKEEWATDNKIILQEEGMNLRHFAHDKAINKYPIIILPPQAGQSSRIPDLAPDQSLVRIFQNNGFDVFVTEWLPAKDGNLGIEHFINCTDKAVDKIRETTGKDKVIMVGQCQGGWQSAMYTSLHNDKIASLVVAASPIDFEAEPGILNYYVDLIPQSYFEAMVKSNKNIMPGEYIIGSYKMMQTIDNYAKCFRLFNMAMKQDDKAIKRHETFENWYEGPQDLPGKFYLETVKYVFKENCLANPGTFKVNGKDIDLKNVDCPLILLAGKKDHMVPVKQVHAMKDMVSTSQNKVTLMEAPGGHIGTLIGKSALKKEWVQICGKLKEMTE